MPWICIDFETTSATELKKAGAWRYAECPTTHILCLALQDHQGRKEIWRPGMNIPKLWQDAVYLGWTIIAHNAAFEKAILRSILVPDYGWPDAPNEQWADTMMCCAMRALPLALDDAAEVLELKVQKDTEGSKLVRSLSKPDKKGWLPAITPAVRSRVEAYCAQDVDAEVELHHRLGTLPEQERKLWLYDQRMNERGLRLDLGFVDAAQRVVDAASGPLRAEFLALTGLPKFGSPALRPWLAGHGVYLPNLQAETLDEFMADTTLEPAHPARRALTIRQLIGSSSIKKLEAMKACVCFDGRARGLFVWHGTVPGRGVGRLFQPQNFPRGFDYDYDVDALVAAITTGDPEWLAMLFGNPVDAVVSSLRHAVISDPDKLLISGDFEKIQACIVLALAGQGDKAAILGAGLDVYCDMAASIYKRPITKADKAERHIGKNAVLGLGFGMGHEKFLAKYAKGQPIEFAQRVVQTYRKEWAPKVPYLWYGLEDAAANTVWTKKPHEFNGVEYRMEDGWLTCRSPAGSKIWYFDPKPERVQVPWDAEKTKKGFSFATQKTGHWIRKHAFGGQLAENIVMRMEVDIKNVAIRNLEENGYPVVLDVHDELVCEVERPDKKVFKDLMLHLPAWTKQYNIPISISEPWINSRYRK